MTFHDEQKRRVTRALGLLRPWEALVRPVFFHWERVPEARPLLFVGNHTTWGFWDVPYLFAALWRERGIFLRGLGDLRHFQIPVWGRLLAQLGAVPGTREEAGALLAAGESVLVYPGGAREVAKRKGEKYRLLWKERLGFAHLAIQHRARVVPFASVGIEDALDIVYDANDLLASRWGGVVRRLGLKDDFLPPVVRGLGYSPLPRPERLYYGFGRTLDAGEFSGSEEGARALRDAVRAEVEAQLLFLQQEQARDPQRTLWGRLTQGPRSNKVSPLRV